jgi:hypothetical protein
MSVVNTKPLAGTAIRAQTLPPLNRDQEAALAAIQGALFGAGKSCLIEGAAGTGKTRLVVELVPYCDRCCWLTRRSIWRSASRAGRSSARQRPGWIPWS